MITWTMKNSDGTTSTKVSYVGLTISSYIDGNFRAMSDVYCDALIAKVWDPEAERVVEILVKCYFECDTREVEVTHDATPEILEKIAEQAATAAAVRTARAHLEAVEREATRVAVGRKMTVTRGRKVPPGTTGVVFWVRDGRAGLDVTGKRDARGKIVDPVFVNAGYLRAS